MDAAVLDDHTTNQILNIVEKEYTINSIELHDQELDAILNEIDANADNDEKSHEAGSPASQSPRSGSENEIPTPHLCPDNEYSKRCNAILNDTKRLNDTLQAIYGWCGQKGLTLLNSNTGGYDHLPIALFPHSVSLQEWLDLRKCSLIFHKLIDRMARDSEFLLSRMKCIADADPEYTGKFYNIYKKKIAEKQFNTKYLFCSLRMDYMRNGNRNQIWSQIESQFTPGGPGWIDKMNKLHQFVLHRYVMDREIPIYDTRNSRNNMDSHALYVPPNDTLHKFTGAMATAAKLVHNEDPLVLMVSDSSRQDCNLVAQYLWDVHRVKSMFRTYAEIGANGRIEEGSHDLIMDGQRRVSFVYCRGGSKRKEWNDTNEMDWKGRELIEFCSAICDANIAYTLINTKFMQTIYSEKEVLLKYLDEDEAEFVHLHFVENHNFDERFESKERIEQILNDAKINYDHYVMKPSGDGGGHCVFGEEIVDLIEKLSKKENKESIQLEGWILMEKIKNCTAQSIHIRQNKWSHRESVHEIGIYSHYLCDAATGDLVLINECIGDLIKTRNANANEAGIAAGYGVLDSMVLHAAQ
eukprot:653876_1